jgi:hypothetical protein
MEALQMSLEKANSKTEIVSPDFFNSPEFQAFKKAWNSFYKDIEKIKTSHKKKKRPVGKTRDGRVIEEDYLEESYMRALLNEHFPGWSLETKQLQVVSNRLVLFMGELIIIDIAMFKFLTANGVPPEKARYERRFPAVGGGLYHFSSDTGNVLSESNPVKKAVSEGLKFAINRLTNIGNDVYRKAEESVGLTTDEIKRCTEAIINSSLNEEEKAKAFEKMLEISSLQVDLFINKIKEKERNRS